jgi:dynein heavy chain
MSVKYQTRSPGGLGGERERWGAMSTRLQEDLDTLLGDVLLASAVVTYLGPFTNSYR